MTDRQRYSSARSEDTYNYSDNFSDDDPVPDKSAPEKKRTRGRGRNQGKGHGRGRGQGRHSQAQSDTQLDVVTKQLLSASRLKMNELQNQVEEMRKQLKVVTDENKLYKRMQHKQERALVKFEDRESELPQMIQAHNNEVRSLREQLRRTKEKYEKTDRYLRDAEDELERVNSKAKKYKALADQKDLAERSDLDQRLNKAELSIEEKECRIRELERHMEILKKNHRHELGIERARYKDAQKQLEEVKDTNIKLEAVLKEKEKQLEAKNIYSNRLLKPSSYNGTPAESPAPWRQSLKKKSGSMTDLTPRNKARAYEEKRKAKEEKKNEKEKPEQNPEHKQKWEDEDREKEQEDSIRNPTFTFKSLQRDDSDADFWRRQEERYKQDKDNREKQEEGQRQKAEEEKSEHARFQQQREKLQQDMEERERKERERREADEREHCEQEKREREEKEWRDRERKEAEQQDRDRKEAEKRERERKELERQAKEERDRLDNDPHVAEERRKKDELLRRLRQLDANQDGSQPSSNPFTPSDSTAGRRAGGDHSTDPFAPSHRKVEKDPFSQTGEDSNQSSLGHRKDYAFTRPVENMHQGKPAREDVSVPYIDRQKKVKAAKDDDIEGYHPSFSGPRKASGSAKKKPFSLFDDSHVSPAPSSDSDKKAKLMSILFGSHQAVSSSSTKKDDVEDDFLTSESPPPKQQAQPNRSQGFPWDGPSSDTKSNGSAHRESSTLFGGGAALVDDDVNGSGGAKSTLLPKRTRQAATTFNSKPTMVAVDNLDDDIEEVIL